MPSRIATRDARVQQQKIMHKITTSLICQKNPTFDHDPHRREKTSWICNSECHM